jgi:hypothetical protein
MEKTRDEDEDEHENEETRWIEKESAKLAVGSLES